MSSPPADESDAQALAAQLLPPLGDRWRHVQRVAQRASDLAPTLALPVPERSLLVDSAWLHDIGYAHEVVRTGFHPLDGARFLETIGFPRRVVCLVAHHSGAAY